MARLLTPPPARAAGTVRAGALLWAIPLALLLHLLVLTWLRWQLQPASVLRDLPPTFYTRTLVPQAAPAPPAADQPIALVAQKNGAPAVARITSDAINSEAKRPPKPPRPKASAPPRVQPARERLHPEAADSPDAAARPAPAALSETAAPAALSETAAPAAEAEAPAVTPPSEASADEPPAVTALAEASATEPAAPAATPTLAASNAQPDFLASWPTDTRLTYRLGGNYRGELHGDAEVLWQREGTRYQAVVRLDVGWLLSSRFTSQGEITAAGLRPERYEEQVRQRRRGVRLSPESVRLQSGERVPRPQDVQDAASQFVELGHRFATGQLSLQAGRQVDFWLARPSGVDAWTYDVVGEETVYLPRLGAIQAFHLKPRPLAAPRGNISAEMWFAPSLQYLPVRIRITQGADTYVDLLVETVEQK